MFFSLLASTIGKLKLTEHEEKSAVGEAVRRRPGQLPMKSALLIIFAVNLFLWFIIILAVRAVL